MNDLEIGAAVGGADGLLAGALVFGGYVLVEKTLSLKGPCGTGIPPNGAVAPGNAPTPASGGRSASPGIVTGGGGSSAAAAGETGVNFFSMYLFGSAEVPLGNPSTVLGGGLQGGYAGLTVPGNVVAPLGSDGSGSELFRVTAPDGTWEEYSVHSNGTVTKVESGNPDGSTTYYFAGGTGSVTDGDFAGGSIVWGLEAADRWQ